MLDIMRQKKRMTAIVLWGVIIALALSMLVWGINVGGSSGSTGPTTYAAMVDDRIVTIEEFMSTYNLYIRRLKEQFPEELDPELIQSLGLFQQVLSELVQEKIFEILAERYGLSVSPNEVRQAILTDPGLQVDGEFVGLEQYKLMVARSEWVSVENYEAVLRNNILRNKLIHLISDSLDISDEELRKEFSRRNQTTKVEYLVLKKTNFQKQIQPTEDELEAYFEKNKNDYQIEEKRRAEYLLVPTSKILPGIEVSEDEIKEEWTQNPVPESVETAHILFRVSDPAEEESVRARAESVLKQVRDGGDFAALARQYSEDTASAEQGGYLGYFPRGQLAKEFEDAAFSLEQGEISDLVRTPEYGYHIIKVFRHERPTLESNRNELFTTIQLRKAKEQAKKKAEEAARLAADSDDLQSAGKNLDVEIEVKETGLFSREDNPYSLGISQALSDDIFKIEEIGALGSVVEHTLGFAFARLQEVQKARTGTLEDFREQVNKDLTERRAVELMEEEATKISENAKESESLTTAARKFGYKVQTSPDFKIEESPGSEIEDQYSFNFMAFSLEQGDISKPIPMSDTVAILEVKERSPFDEEAFEEGKTALYDEMYLSLQNAYLGAYLRSFQEKLEEEEKLSWNPRVSEMVDNLRF